MVLSPAKKRTGRYCCAYACTNEPIARKGGLCHKHYARKLREKDPVAVRYNQFKNNAKTRGKVFSITLDEFRGFCARTGYIVKKGRRGKAATIDRRCNAHGYHIWNIQILTLSQNSSKGAGSSQDCPFWLNYFCTNVLYIRRKYYLWKVKTI